MKVLEGEERLAYLEEQVKFQNIRIASVEESMSEEKRGEWFMKLHKAWLAHYKDLLKQKQEELDDVKKQLDRIKNPCRSDAKTKNIKISKCEGCGKMVDVTDGVGSGYHEGCNFVWGRRGWRQLGVYDG